MTGWPVTGRRLARLVGLGTSYTAPGHPLAQRLRRLSALEQRDEAHAFLDTFHTAAGHSRQVRVRRWAEVRRSLSRQGFYEHTPEELAFGARLAWRNSGRCVGRLFWESLDVVDCRTLTAPDAMAERIALHLAEAVGDGRIRSVVSVFAPVRTDRLPAYVESPQITRYAGHLRPDGTVLGDRASVEATRIARTLGWSPRTESRFDLLPYFLRDAQDRRIAVNLAPGAVREVTLRHPRAPAFAELGLRWYAVPVMSGMILTIGGIDYPCAPFNGFYMATEIASRNLVDRERFDALPEVAHALGLEPEGRDPFWQDTALTELNRAVVHSFREDGVTLVDHHTADAQFMEFHRREQAAGRRVSADWRWIVPPQSSAASEAFHLRMRDFHPVPSFYHGRSEDGWRLMPWRGDRERSRLTRDLDRVRRRWRLWRRTGW